MASKNFLENGYWNGRRDSAIIRKFDFFAGGKVFAAGDRFSCRHVISENDIIIATENVRAYNGNYLLIVGPKNAAYLQPWQTREIYLADGHPAFMIRLTRSQFKVYTFHAAFSGLASMSATDFDGLVTLARSQDNASEVYVPADPGALFLPDIVKFA